MLGLGKEGVVGWWGGGEGAVPMMDFRSSQVMRWKSSSFIERSSRSIAVKWKGGLV